MAKSPKFMNGQNLPATRTLTFKGEGDTPVYIDIARELSAHNNRLYRQGMIYHLANVKFSCRNDFKVHFNTVPNTWSTHAAWKMAFRNWLNSNRERMDDGSLRTVAKLAKWSDFRLAMRYGAVVPGYDDNKWMHPQSGRVIKSQSITGQDTLLGIDEWELSQYTSSDESEEDMAQITNHIPDLFTGHVLGLHQGTAEAYESVGIIKAFQETLEIKGGEGDLNLDGDASDDQDIATGVWANLMEVTGTTTPVVEHLIDDFNEAPFNRQSFPGAGGTSNISRLAILDPGGQEENQPGGEIIMPGFEVPLGMLEVLIDGTEDTEWYIQLELVPGQYMGVAAESMGTPKLNSKKVWTVR